MNIIGTAIHCEILDEGWPGTCCTEIEAATKSQIRIAINSYFYQL